MSSSLCPTSCSALPTTFSGTLTGGIQDVSALLPLLGTEQCEEHVSSALTNGYLYAAASPMSLFGSLGLARAGFKTLLASVNFSIRGQNINGATMLSNMGFQPKGENLSLIMADKENEGRYVIESRLDTLLEELHVDETRIIGVSHKTKTWNTIMIALTGLLSSISIVPYIYLNTGPGSGLSRFARWSFPVLRAIGGFLTSTTIQLTLQRRITTITRNWLTERIRRRKRDHVGQEQTAEEDERSLGGDDRDAEKGLEDTGPKGNTTDRLTWVLLVLLFLGDVASVIGYIGCFSVVQSAQLSSGPLSWLCSEVGLSLVRIFLWGLNPKMDDAPPLEFILKLNDDPPLLTCNRSNDQIWKDKILPLTRASPFLNSITSFAGLITHFGRPGLTLYYTLTRAGPNPKSNVNENEQTRSAHERVPYITIFDHKERTTRVFTRHRGVNHFYSVDVPDVDLEHGLLEAKLGEKINSKNDPIVGDGDIQALLVEHYQSLVHSTISRVGRNTQYRIGNAWTMKVAGVVLASDEGVDARDDADDRPARDLCYLKQGQFEEMRRSLDAKRGKWIETYMHQVIAETREWFQAEKASIGKVDGVLVDEAKTAGKRIEAGGEEIVEKQSNLMTVNNDHEVGAVERLLIQEWRCMEKLLVYEVEEWEEKLWKITEEFILTDGVQEKERVESEWRANCWKRLDADIRAMNERMEAAKGNVKGTSDHLSSAWQDAHRDIQKTWEFSVKRFVGGPPRPFIRSCRDRLDEDFQTSTNSMQFRYLRSWQGRIRRLQDEMESRLRKELDDVEFRLGQGLEKCDQFYGSDHLVRARHSRAKWFDISMISNKAERDFFSRALRLKTRNDVIYINFWGCDDDWVIETIRDLASLTSVYVRSYFSHPRLPDIQRDSLLFVDTKDTNISTFLDDNQSRLAETHRTFIFISHMHGPFPTFTSTEIGLQIPTLAISFFGPSSGSLTLRLRHRSSAPNATLTLTVTGFPTFKIPVPSSLTTNDITLHPRPSERLSFMPDSRNNLIIQAKTSYSEVWFQDIQLLDEAGHPYDPRPSEALDLSQVSTTSNVPMPASPSLSENEMWWHSPVPSPAESEIDGISEGTEETGDVKVVQSVAEEGGVTANSGIEEERR